MDPIQNEIFLARHYGNVSPEEFMVPYPNLGELVTGQNIKHSQKMVFSDHGVTNQTILEKSGQYANWLKSIGVGYKDRIHLSGIDGMEAIFLTYGIWLLGASLVIGNNNDPDLKINISLTKNSLPSDEKLKEFDSILNSGDILQLDDEALIVCSRNNVILSHYNLLLNAIGIQQILLLDESSIIFTKTDALTLPWVILQVILPLTSGAVIKDEKSAIRIYDHPSEKVNFTVEDFIDYEESRDQDKIYFLTEVGGAISIGEKTLPLIKLNINGDQLKIQGHAVTMGYTDPVLNAKVFKNGWLNISHRS